MGGRLLAVFLAAATIALIVVGTLWPVPAAAAYAGMTGAALLRSSSTPEQSVDNLAIDLSHQEWQKAYSVLSNKNEFTEREFIRGTWGSQRAGRPNRAIISAQASSLPCLTYFVWCPGLQKWRPLSIWRVIRRARQPGSVNIRSSRPTCCNRA